MSIRLRFTLLYSAILAVMLIVFGVVLYSTQAQTSYSALQDDLVYSADKLEGSLKIKFKTIEQYSSETEVIPTATPVKTAMPTPTLKNPVTFSNFSDEPAFKEFPEREIARVLDADGTLLASPFGREEDVLPLSEAALQEVKTNGDTWLIITYQDQRMLIYSRMVEKNGEPAFIVQAAKPLTERDRTLSSLAATLIGTSLFTLAVAFGIGWAFSGITFQPVHRMTKNAREIGEERDFTRRLEYIGPQDELGQLATTFNGMLNQLDAAHQQVEHSLEMQRNFVADVSHELRTPLTTLRGNLGLLTRKPPIPEDDQKDILDDMVDESDRLIRLVNDLLILARADAGRSLAKDVVELKPLLEEVCRQSQLLDMDRSILLTCDDLLVLGDRDAIKQVLLIVMDNALKHSTGNVEVNAYAAENNTVIKVKDYGPGIPAEKLEHIFERFYRGGDAAEVPGFGLGLAIARNLVEAQHGEIDMESEMGQGSELTIRFPAL